MQRLQKLPTRQKVMLGVVLVAAIVGGWWYFIYSPKKDQLKKYAADVVQQQGMVTILEKKFDTFQILKKEVEELRAKANVMVVLPSKAELPAFFDALQSDSTLAGVQIVKWENQPEVPFSTVEGMAAVAPGTPGATQQMASAAPSAAAPGTPGAPGSANATLAVKVPVAIVVTGTFQQINRYFYAIYGGSATAAGGSDKRLISIEALAIRPIMGSNALPTGKLVAGFVASTFRQPDGPVVPQGGAPPPVVPGAPGKKADVGDKMEK